MDHILSIVLFTPLAGLLVLLLLPSSNPRAIKLFANAVAFIGFLVSLPLVFNFDHTKDYQFEEKCQWIPSIGATYHVGIDGLGLLLVIMEGLWLKTGNDLYHQMSRFWTRVFALTFAIGVAVDRSGDVFAVGNGELAELPAVAGGYGAQQLLPTVGIGDVTSIAVDGADDVFAGSDATGGVVDELTKAGVANSAERVRVSGIPIRA